MITAHTMLDLVRKVYAIEGWTKGASESWIARVKTKYEITMDQKANRFIATPKEN